MYQIIFITLFIPFLLFANEKVTLQLKWFHQFQFAGYYAAKEKGFYSDVGIDVEIKERDLKYNNIEQVISGKAQYGVGDSVLMLYKAKNEPVVIVSPIFQHSPNTLISLKENNITSLYDLKDKRILFYPNDTDGLAILSILKKFNISNVKLIRNRTKDDYFKLINNEVDLMVGYLSNEPFYFKERGINIINPAHYGFDLYGDMLFTNESEVLNHPQRVKKFKEATLKGWEYALNNKDEIINLIFNKYSKRKSIEHLKYEADAIEYVISRNTIPLGSFDKGRIQYIADLYKEQKLLKNVPNIKKFIFEDYLFEINANLTNDEKDYLLNKEVLKVANLKSFYPYNYNINGNAQGYIIDYINLLSKSLNIKVEYVLKPWNELLSMIRNNEIDIIPNIAVNEERSKYIDYTNFSPILYQTALGIPSNSKVKSLKDLSGKKASIMKSSFLEKIIKELYPSIELHTTNTVEEAVKLLSEQKVDAVLGELSILEYNTKFKWLNKIKIINISIEDDVISTTPLYMGVKKDNLLLKSILEKTNSSLSNSTKLELKRKWLEKTHINSLDFTKDDYKYLSNKKSINYCINQNRIPLENFSENKHLGISSDFIRIIEDKTDLNFNLISTGSSFINNESCELVSLVVKKKDIEKSRTNEFLSFPLAVATTFNESYIASFKKLYGKKIGYVKNSVDIGYLKQKYPNVFFKEVVSIKKGLELVIDNKLYGVLGALPELGYNIQKNYQSDIKVSGNLDEKVEYAFNVNKDNFQLISIINKVLDSITQEEKDLIFNKWINIKYEKDIDIKKLLLIFLVFSIIVLIITYKNRQIKDINKEMKRYIKIVDEHILTSTTDLDGNITYASKAFCDITGYKREELIGKNHNIIRHKDMPNSLYKNLWETIKIGKKWSGEIKNKKKDGSFYWVDVNVEPMYNSKNEIYGYMSVRHDITDKKKVEEISITDELTGLYNRRYFNQVLHQELSRAKRDCHPFALIIFDVDFFKQYNDNYGHQRGDVVLKEIGKALKSICKRTSDFPFRIGGEEFAVIFSPHFKENAVEFANIINKRIEELKIEHDYSNVSNFVTISVGLYFNIGEEIESEEDVYNFTDQALYNAKERGRNQVVIYDKTYN